MTRAAVFGASGFVGRAVVAALCRRDAEVVAIAAPRVITTARDMRGLAAELESAIVQVQELSQRLIGCDVVVNAAGLATATGSGDELFGADALLPGIIAAAAPVGVRVVHVSSAAVQGARAVLDEAVSTSPFSDYSTAKALGEELVRHVRPDAVAFRPTSVQGPGREVTATLLRFARSPLASVAGEGARPTPQVLVENVGDAIAYVALTEEPPPAVVLQPSEGLTVAELLRMLGGKEPWHVPEPIARGLVRLTRLVGRRSSKVAAISRRLEMLWFGQDQERGWLSGRWKAPVGRSGWDRERLT